MQEKEKLFIPQGLKHKDEFFNGFGKEEAAKSFSIIVLMLVFIIPLFMVTRNIPLCVAVYLFLMFATVGAFVKDDNTNQSIVKLIKSLIRFHKSQKHYPYKALKEWKY